MDGDGPDVFDRTVEWAVGAGLETATFHIMTPYPGTALFRRMDAAGRIVHRDWDRYDTRHVVYRPRGLSAEQLEAGVPRLLPVGGDLARGGREAGPGPVAPSRVRRWLEESSSPCGTR